MVRDFENDSFEIFAVNDIEKDEELLHVSTPLFEDHFSTPHVTNTHFSSLKDLHFPQMAHMLRRAK